MLDRRALGTDLPVDICLTLAFLVQLNTAYKNSRHTWVGSRFKTLRKIHWAFIVAVIPLDWLAWVCGVSPEVASFLRKCSALPDPGRPYLRPRENLQDLVSVHKTLLVVVDPISARPGEC